MRLRQTNNSQENQNQRNFAEFLLKIGNAKYLIELGTEDIITLPLNMSMSEGNLTDLINFVYPNLAQNIGNINYMVGRAILTPKTSMLKRF